MQNEILKLLAGRSYKPSNVPELLRQLRLPRNEQQQLQHELQALQSSGQIRRLKGNRYVKGRELKAAPAAPRNRAGRFGKPARSPHEANIEQRHRRRDQIQKETDDGGELITGRIRLNKAGKGYFQPDDENIKEMEIPGYATSTAMDQDKVVVRRSTRQSEKAGGSGSVVEVVERKRNRVVGTFRKVGRTLVVLPDDPRLPNEIIVPAPRDVGRPAYEGDKVVVELNDWTSQDQKPEGKIIEVLGSPTEEGVDMLSVLRQFDMPLSFPDNVLNEANAIGSVVHEGEVAGREDCRGHMVVTIDPDDAKDFDDAICLQREGKTRWKLWVHIADVSHYVKPGTALDKEARKRGNSTYLVDRVIPMLPEGLSNELCSLKPHVDRLTKCVEFLISNEGKVISTKFYAAVIHSKHRFTYREVLAVLQRDPQDDSERMLHAANELAQKIRKLRFKAGSLELDMPETKIRLDEHGKVSRIEKVENDTSHQLIEEYMLLANEAVATKLLSQDIQAIHRIHEAPEEERLNDFREQVLAYNIPCGNLSERTEVQKLLALLTTEPAGEALKIGFLKSLMRARYATQALGHYGLAKEKYAHFTSPIRRYADLVVHRALFQSDHGSTHSLTQISDHISDTERNSADAERASKDVKLYAFLNEQIASGDPQRYQALVIEVRPYGLFVDVGDLAMSGLVPMSFMDDDYYVFEPARNHLIGRRTRKIFKVGDKIEVQVAKVDSLKKMVDFRLGATASRQEAAPRASQGQRPAPAHRGAQSQRPPQEQRSAPAHRAPQGARPPQGQRNPQGSRPPQGQRSPQGSRPPQSRPGQEAPRETGRLRFEEPQWTEANKPDRFGLAGGHRAGSSSRGNRRPAPAGNQPPRPATGSGPRRSPQRRKPSPKAPPAPPSSAARPMFKTSVRSWKPSK